jgi:hypothetical protein
MKRNVTTALLMLTGFLLLPGLGRSQNAGLDLSLVSADADSVVLKATMYTGTGVSFRLESVTIGVKYDPAKFGTRYSRSVMNHRLASAGFEADTVQLYDIDLVYPDILHYGEMPPWSNPNLNILIPQNSSLDLCTFTFFRLSTLPDTTSFLLTTGFLTGYYITTAIPKQDFTPLNSLFGITFPVELTSFTAAQQGAAVALKWVTATETNNSGFYIERRRFDGSAAWESIGFARGQGTTWNTSAYLFLDDKLPGNGAYEYRLRQEDFDGKVSFTQSARVEYRDSPAEFRLEQNYPNPVSASDGIPALLRYSISERGAIRLVITNALGQHVAELVHRIADPGHFTAEWTPRGQSTGIYLATLTAQNERGESRTQTVRIRVVK